MAATLGSESPPAAAPSFATRVYQWHAALAPYAGVVLTFLLAFSAGLLYWATFGRPQSATSIGGAIEATPLWTSESLDPTTIGQNDMQIPTAPKDAEEFSWTSPIVSDRSRTGDQLEDQDQGRDVDDAAALTADADAGQPVPECVAAPASDPLETKQIESSQTAAVEAPVAVKPTKTVSDAPLSISYPTTPFASFDFGLTAAPEPATAADQTSQPVVAELQAGATNAASSR